MSKKLGEVEDEIMSLAAKIGDLLQDVDDDENYERIKHQVYEEI